MMRTLIAALFLLAVPAFAQNPLREAVAGGATSMAWKISTKGVSICCCDEQRGFYSTGKNYIEYTEIILVAKMENRRVTRVRMVEPSCAVRVQHFINNVAPEASIEFLLEHLGDDGEDRTIAAIAMHDHPRAVTELIQLARHHRSSEVRRDAIFWLGQHAGEKAAGELRRAVDEDPEDDVRERAVFAISQLPNDRAVPILIDLVKNHKRPVVRKRAMFWLAQSGDPRALELIEEILGVR